MCCRTATPSSRARSASTSTAAAVGLGTRSKRYAMIVDDGVVKALMVEDAPAQAEKSSASAILAAL